MDAGPPTNRRSALITGASAGIGQAFAEHLARDGYSLTVVARNQERLDALAARLRAGHGVEVDIVVADLTQGFDVSRVEDCLRDSSDLDLLINNAGFGTYGRFAELPPEAEMAEINLNVVALVRLTRAALPGMIARGEGAIINVSSMAGFQAAPFNATYGATKAYVTSFTEAISEELRGTGVRVQALCPGFTRTEFQDRAGIDVSGLPSLAWMSAEAVVDSSLTGLDSGDVVHVPGFTNRLVSGAAGLIPRSLLRWVGGKALASRGG